MANMNVDQMVEELSSWSVMDVASLVKAKYGDSEPRQPRPNANRGDNVTGSSPYQDTPEDMVATMPAL